MKIININELTRESVLAALSVIDAATNGFTKQTKTSCGDSLAYNLDSIIKKALIELSQDQNNSPAFIKFKTDND